MIEYTFDEFCQLPMGLDMHISMITEHYITKRQKDTDVCKTTITKIKRNGEIGKSKTFFTYDGKAYDTADQVYVAYMAKACGVKHD